MMTTKVTIIMGSKRIQHGNMGPVWAPGVCDAAKPICHIRGMLGCLSVPGLHAWNGLVQCKPEGGKSIQVLYSDHLASTLWGWDPSPPLVRRGYRLPWLPPSTSRSFPPSPSALPPSILLHLLLPSPHVLFPSWIKEYICCLMILFTLYPLSYSSSFLCSSTSSIDLTH